MSFLNSSCHVPSSLICTPQIYHSQTLHCQIKSPFSADDCSSGPLGKDTRGDHWQTGDPRSKNFFRGKNVKKTFFQTYRTGDMAWWEKVADFWWGEGWEEWLVPFALSLSRKTDNMSSNKLISDHHRRPLSFQVLLFHLLFNHDRAACYGGWLGTFASSSRTITGSTPMVTRIKRSQI